MTSHELIQRYKSLNESFKPILIYHLGIDAGFFAEYTYMLHAMLYCLQQKIQFRLYSADANFRCNRGWSDYFLPFCPEVCDEFHHTYNMHRLPSWGKLLQDRNGKLLRWKLKCTYLNWVGDYLAWRRYGKRVRLNHHVRFDINAHFSIPELEIDGDYLHAFRKMADITWQLNPDTRQAGDCLCQTLRLPEQYVGCQVRGGDKITETELLSPEYYLHLIREKSTEQHVFVLTDDIRLFHSLQTLAPELHWYTLCSPQEQGYVNSSFSQEQGEKKKQQMVRFLTSMQLLMQSSLFVGSVTTGPSLFLLKWFHPHHCPADCLPEQFPQIARLPVAGRSEAAGKYLQNRNFPI
ncbi:MAG: hypothetical protein IJZ86_00145 [Bacteroides sp.]|nr:hypothetical protein [Bacteroides sp.]